MPSQNMGKNLILYFFQDKMQSYDNLSVLFQIKNHSQKIAASSNIRHNLQHYLHNHPRKHLRYLHQAFQCHIFDNHAMKNEVLCSLQTSFLEITHLQNLKMILPHELVSIY